MRLASIVYVFVNPGCAVFVRFFYFCISMARKVKFVLTPDSTAWERHQANPNLALIVFYTLHPSSLDSFGI